MIIYTVAALFNAFFQFHLQLKDPNTPHLNLKPKFCTLYDFMDNLLSLLDIFATCLSGAFLTFCVSVYICPALQPWLGVFIVISSWYKMYVIDVKRFLHILLDEEEDAKAEEGAFAGTSADLAGMSSDEDADKCPICLNSFNSQPVATPESCEHYFCLDCILEWAKVGLNAFNSLGRNHFVTECLILHQYQCKFSM